MCVCVCVGVGVGVGVCMCVCVWVGVCFTFYLKKKTLSKHNIFSTIRRWVPEVVFEGKILNKNLSCAWASS